MAAVGQAWAARSTRTTRGRKAFMMMRTRRRTRTRKMRQKRRMGVSDGRSGRGSDEGVIEKGRKTYDVHLV